MKINKSNMRNISIVGEIKYGNCFVWKSDIYIQVNDPLRPCCAVSLSTGKLVEFEDGFELVVAVNAEVNIVEGQ